MSKIRKIKDWICNGNDCEKCKFCWAERTSYEYDEWDAGCYIKGEDYDEKPCHLINPIKHILGTLAKKKDNYYRNHQYDGFLEFSEEQDRKDNEMRELINKHIIGDYILCMRYSDGTLHECNTESIVHNNAWEVRHDYEEFAYPYVREKLSTEWCKLIKKTLKCLYNKTFGRLIPYIKD